MIEIANQWLQNHGHLWEVVNCETIIILFKYQDNNNYELKPNDCCFYIYGSEKNNVLRALRLWIRRRMESLAPGMNPQSISFKDVIPKFKNNLSCEFEDLDCVINRLNNDINQNGLNGRIVSIESVVYDANLEWEIDTETSLSTLSTKNVFILRIFYEVGEKTFAQIGIEDFHPKQLTRATFFKRPKFETFDQVIERGFIWLRQNPQKRFVNAQSIDVKMKSCKHIFCDDHYNYDQMYTYPSSINSRLMAFTEHGNYMRVFRITYLELDPMQKPLPHPITLSTRMFLPHKKTDTITDITQRLSDWINQYLEKIQSRQKKLENDDNHDNQQQKQQQQQQQQFTYPSVLTAETVEVFAKDFRHDRSDIERAANDETFLANRFGNKNAYLFFSMRIFYDTTLMSSESVTNVTMVSDNNSSWTINTLANIKSEEEEEQ